MSKQSFFFSEQQSIKPEFSRTECCCKPDRDVSIFPRMLAKDELISLLQRCVEILERSKSKKMKNALGQLRDLLAKLQQLDGKLSE